MGAASVKNYTLARQFRGNLWSPRGFLTVRTKLHGQPDSAGRCGMEVGVKEVKKVVLAVDAANHTLDV